MRKILDIRWNNVVRNADVPCKTDQNYLLLCYFSDIEALEACFRLLHVM